MFSALVVGAVRFFVRSLVLLGELILLALLQLGNNYKVMTLSNLLGDVLLTGVCLGTLVTFSRSSLFPG